MRNYLKKHLSGIVRGILLPVLVVVVLLLFFTGLSNIRQGSDGQGKEQLEESIRRTAVACYSTEGVYPPSIAYMQEHYGLQVDEERFYVDYQVFAPNFMPTFTVLEIDGN